MPAPRLNASADFRRLPTSDIRCAARVAERRLLDPIGYPAIEPAATVAASAQPSAAARRTRRGKCDCAG
ncbi:hypothetical protein DM77_878 [Burkholderia mallei]|nr:hypothetical protein DM77_878 [Burkholderia mallei]